MVIVSYVRECLAWHSEVERKGIGANEFMLWHAILDIMNEEGSENIWPDTFVQVPNPLLLSRTGFSQDTLERVRNKLAQMGYIQYIPGKKRSAMPKYKMNYFCAKAVPATDIHITVENLVDKAVDKPIIRTVAVKTADKSADKPADKTADKTADIEEQTKKRTYTKTSDAPLLSLPLSAYACPQEGIEEEDLKRVFGKNPEALTRFLQEDHSPDLIGPAVKMAIAHEEPLKSPVGYMRTLVTDWEKRGLHTEAEINAAKAHTARQGKAVTEQQYPQREYEDDSGRLPAWMAAAMGVEEEKHESN